jgi:Pyruvate/2-oxoacid:ferredoxin oxidoreductase gamma subunit
MIGSVLRATDMVKIASLEEPLRHRFGQRAGGNLQACRKAYEATLLV